MRGADIQPMNLFSYIQLEQRAPRKHPLRAIRKMVDIALVGMDKLFSEMYSATGRTGTIAARADATNTVHNTFGTTVGGADRL